MLIGYVKSNARLRLSARVSMTVQNLHLQKDALQEAGCDKIFVDQISSRAYDREGLQKAMEFIRSSDTLVVWRLDRLGRSLGKFDTATPAEKHLIEFCTQLQEKGIFFKSLKKMKEHFNVPRKSSSFGLLKASILTILSDFAKMTWWLM